MGRGPACGARERSPPPRARVATHPPGLGSPRTRAGIMRPRPPGTGGSAPRRERRGGPGDDPVVAQLHEVAAGDGGPNALRAVEDVHPVVRAPQAVHLDPPWARWATQDVRHLPVDQGGRRLAHAPLVGLVPLTLLPAGHALSPA